MHSVQSEACVPDAEVEVQGQGQTKQANKTKLPKLVLPRFSGNPAKWTPFWDSFSSAIDENADLNDMDIDVEVSVLKITTRRLGC